MFTTALADRRGDSPLVAISDNTIGKIAYSGHQEMEAVNLVTPLALLVLEKPVMAVTHRINNHPDNKC